MTRFRINGREVSIDADDDTPLLWVIRDDIGLTGTKFGCGIGAVRRLHRPCRTAQAVRSCSTRLADVAGAEVTTIEGLDPAGRHPVQLAWSALQVPQCGYCQSGQIMQAAALLKDDAEAQRRRYRQCHGRQFVPLHDLCPHPRRHQGRREGQEATWL